MLWGGLGLYELRTEKSAEVILLSRNEPLKDKEDSQAEEGPNIESSLNSIRSFGRLRSSLFLSGQGKKFYDRTST